MGKKQLPGVVIGMVFQELLLGILRVVRTVS